MPIYNTNQEIEELQAALDAKSPTSHTHAIALIEGLQAALDAKSPTSHTHAIALIEGLQAALDAKSPFNHIHAIALIEGLQAALDAKSPLTHTHAIALIEGLQAALDTKSPTNHQHLPTEWQNLSLSAGWSNYGIGYTVPQCRKFIGGLIEVKGVTKKSTALVANEIITTLPVGYRPSEIMLLATWAGGGTSRIQVEPSGVIRLASGNNSGVGLNFLFGLD
ncbi:hypothetical protein PI95_031775 [Hassallia byssoidea VB512170]|uniref:Uncharacterized protein n=1 Tax=Hassallia byssoidea VB512170 TaxID=1304833 RepID=A0A846HK44_9CYAN|nr:hypothetical protein [Hassalia byssoidea]NEU76954.1 hypothetical protein [Hassalia byssoidea VB512170]